MSNNNKNAGDKKGTWKTKYGPRRVREELPTLEEAIAAAQGLTDELEEQVFVAASLMGLPHDEVRTALLKTAPPRKDVVQTLTFTGPASAPRTVIVERKPSRRIATGAGVGGTGVGASVERVTLRPRSVSAARQSW